MGICRFDKIRDLVDGRFVDLKEQALIDLLDCDGSEEGISQPLVEHAVWPIIVDTGSDEEAMKFVDLVEVQPGVSSPVCPYYERLDHRRSKFGNPYCRE